VNRALLAIPALLALGCASLPNIQTNRDPTVPLPASPTWAWGTRDTISHYELDPQAQNPILHQRVQVAIERTLANKGWKQVAPAAAHLIVTYHIGLKRTTQLETSTTAMGGYGGYYGGWYGGYGWGYYGAPTYVTSTTTPVDYKQGGVLVYVRDRASGKVAWSGLYTKDVHDTDKVTAETIQRGADELLRDLK
jgi:Domain of unknown function (DUF4136)